MNNSNKLSDMNPDFSGDGGECQESRVNIELQGLSTDLEMVVSVKS